MGNYSRKQRIERILSNEFHPNLLIVRDDSKKHQGHTQMKKNSKETHFYIKINFKLLKSSSKLDLHRKIYKLLDAEFSSGLHALELDLNNN